jgi:SAM-dependent methyltransferase
VPWAGLAPNPHLLDWLAGGSVDLDGRQVLVVGCGLGDDAEAIGARGAVVTAFDIAPTAVAVARRRFPDNLVTYVVADLLQPPPDCRAGFDLVVEIYTLQVLPKLVRARSLPALARLTAPAGSVMVISRLRDERDRPGMMHRPLAAGEPHPRRTRGCRARGLPDQAFKALPDAAPTGVSARWRPSA